MAYLDALAGGATPNQVEDDRRRGIPSLAQRAWLPYPDRGHPQTFADVASEYVRTRTREQHDMIQEDR